MSSLLESLVLEQRLESIIDFNTLSNIFAVSIFTRFLNNKKDSIESSDVEKVWNLVNVRVGAHGFRDTIPKRRYAFSSSQESTIIDFTNEKFNNVLNSCLLYANENPDIKSLIIKWASDTESSGYVGLFSENGLITLDVELGDTIPFEKKIKLSQETTITYGQTIGQKDLNKDFGLSKQNQFFTNLFGLDTLNKNIVDNYKTIADNESKFDAQSVFEATKYLYNELSYELNKIINVDDITLGNMVNGIHSLIVKESSSEYEVLRFGKNLQIYKVDYNKLRDTLKESDIHISIKETKSPIMVIYDRSRNKELFSIRMRKEKYENNITNNRYKLYFEASDGLLDNILTTL